MRINADFTARVVVDTEALDWVPSPMAGVDRRMLDRLGDEVARATSLVRYAPGSAFSAHTHGGGEEFLVLDGTFEDEHGRYPAGSYIRNPVGSSHVPAAPDGCVLFVKLWQMHPDDQTFVRTDTRGGTFVADPDVPGVARLPLHTFGDERVRLSRLAAGTAMPPHDHPGGEEVLVLEGTLADEDGTYGPGTWLRLPPGSRHAPRSETGCLLYVKLGHLTDVRAPDAAA